MDEVECDEHAQNVVECNWERPDGCDSENAAGVECKHNKGASITELNVHAKNSLCFNDYTYRVQSEKIQDIK